MELQKQVKGNVDWEAVELKRQASERALTDEQPVLPGVEQYLQDAKRLGLKIGLASSSSRKWVMGHLQRLGLESYFDSIYASDDVEHVKPHPELYLSVLNGLGLKASEAIALEDSPIGVQAAKHAGLYCVAVPNPLTSLLSLNQADLQLGSLAEMALEELLDKVNGHLNTESHI